MAYNDVLSERNLKGILFSCLGYFFFSLIGISQKAISPNVPIPIILFFQNLICFLFICTEFFKKNAVSLKPDSIPAYGVRIFSGLGCYALLFYLIRFIPISEAMLYQYSGTLWIPILMFVWLKVRIPNNMWIGIITGFIGVSFILRPNLSNEISYLSMVGIVCGLLQAASMVAVRRLAHEPTVRILFFYFLVGTMVSLPFALKHAQPLLLQDLALLLCVGIFTYFGQKAITIALKHANPGILAPICYTNILYSTLFAWVIWDEVPNKYTFIGMSLVILGCLTTVVFTWQNNRTKEALAS